MNNDQELVDAVKSALIKLKAAVRACQEAGITVKAEDEYDSNYGMEFPAFTFYRRFL